MYGRGALLSAPFSLVLWSAGCRTIEESNVVGTYRASAPCVTISLVLNADHSFVQSLRTTSGFTKELRGSWSLDPSTDRKLIEFKPFLDLLHGERGEQVGGVELRAESIGPILQMGPLIAACPESTHEMNYVK